MHDFEYRNGELYCEKVRVQDIAGRVGTPFYLYSYKTFTDHFLKIKKAFEPVKPLICFAMKANGNLAVLRALVQKGAGLDIVSGGELFKARKAGCPGARIVYAGVGKTDQEIADAIRANILLFNVESIPELENIQRVAHQLKRRVNVSLRINPGIDPHTHDYIATGKSESKFGIDLDTAHLTFMRSMRYPNVSICGLHVHIGSQITDGEPFVKAFRKVLIFVTSLEKEGHRIQYLNLGGGLGIIYSDEKPQTAAEFAKKVLPLFKGRRYKLIFEPGRFIAGNGGLFVTKVLYIKQAASKHYAIVDGGMNDLLRPALYGAYHEILPLTKATMGKVQKYDLVGPICESGDFLATNRKIQSLRSGDAVGLLGAGAYGFTMSSQYNARPRVAEVLVKGNRFDIVRERETYQDLIQRERVPAYLK
ncbi:MAG: diaminopimelate decarboxylase [Candidatus Omnitrophica bacterium CG11_big_fil_rev_8_21_14_0_20_45_26]|uniref:Diaminopimelate decarboxylase n=1 Tax=Candidatus Abzuiibacterium crystallinum TaxID=1974748 RepID=A0A2H0LST0_9BACT|nr:MAG: diaminopimelate decarboxylase [Candidatus Omnitrophica bacterium CG11_big_fil_rev_8_21_14_0_20_45_26]PIW63378.1 MAG: diaminopimelate decarboxylase [Candidatus Omnitrophica bacterium CG12_big_fil_rev_8_21_14_0_65_45_16]